MRSTLAILDADSGCESVVLRTDRLIEAPNWMPDGRALLVNGDGRLWRVPLDAPRLEPVDTGGLHRLNNDHGPSPDGATLAFSDKTETGEACIYTIETRGGAARRITIEVPSYFHGWSPDGRTLCYTARRQGLYDIRTCPATGGAERRLSRGFEHADGPDFTPDGQWIWFNGERDGAVDLWRIRFDDENAAPERMTHGDRVEWFPHPSPDGRDVLFLSYPPGTRYHPRDVEVRLCLMPADGGASRTVARFSGGQGSVNVPCWAPDGRRFAFVRYGSMA